MLRSSRLFPQTPGYEEIRLATENQTLKHWGFVFIRCTYKSQEKWDAFIASLKDEARLHIEYLQYGEAEMDMRAFDMMTWTVIEDLETLDGADIVQTSRRFREWVESEGRWEMEGGEKMTGEQRPGGPRFGFFVHVDEETLESVVDSRKAIEKDGYFFKMVYESMVLSTNDEPKELEEEEEGEKDEEDALRLSYDLTKKVKGNSLVTLYRRLLNNSSTWYYIDVDRDTGIMTFI